MNPLKPEKGDGLDISLLLQEVENILICCVQISGENLIFQHYQIPCHIYCTDTVCLVYFWLKMRRQQLLALLLII
jgi:hypothetical protein